MERFLAETTRPTDCSVLDEMCKINLKTPIGKYLALLQQHEESHCAECAAIAKADQLLELEAEAPCTCRRSDADLFDPRGCEYHDVNSPWNVRLRAITSVQIYESEVA